MTYTAIWIVAFLINGTPVAFAALLPGLHCTQADAQAVFNAKQDEVGRGAFQDGFEYWCDAVQDRPLNGA